MSERRENLGTNVMSRMPNVAVLEDALSNAGFQLSAEAHGTMVVLSERPGRHGDQPWSVERREAVLTLARAHGFTHAALELHDPPVRAPALLRDQSAP